MFTSLEPNSGQCEFPEVKPDLPTRLEFSDQSSNLFVKFSFQTKAILAKLLFAGI